MPSRLPLLFHQVISSPPIFSTHVRFLFIRLSSCHSVIAYLRISCMYVTEMRLLRRYTPLVHKFIPFIHIPYHIISTPPPSSSHPVSSTHQQAAISLSALPFLPPQTLARTNTTYASLKKLSCTSSLTPAAAVRPPVHMNLSPS